MSNETMRTPADVRELAVEIIRNLDLIARNYDSYEYGLPVMTHYDEMVDTVVALLRAGRGEGEAEAESGGDVTVSQLLAVLDEYNAEVFCMTPENADGTPMFSVAIARGESTERLKQWANEDAEESAAIHSETLGVTRCRICCERPAALTLCTECADEALWRSIYDQWLAEEATNARFRAIVHEWRCGMCGHWSPRRCRTRCQRCGAVRGYGYRDREAVEERTVITYPTDRSESDD